jgi:Tfp pilus assembly protein PilO
VNALIERLRAQLERIGRAGVIGIALAVFAAAFYFSAVAPVQAERAALRGEAERLQQRLQTGGLAGGGAKGTPAEQLATFYAFFPPPQSSPEWLGKIHAAAQAKGLVLRSGEYRLERSADQRLARYQITLPVAGSYAQIRGFVGQVLADVPAAALEEITLRRESVSSPTLEARLRLTLYLGSA